MYHYKSSLAVLVLYFCFTTNWCWADVDFDRLHGADLGMGIGARAIAMAGAFAAVADDATAVFWNPSGLTQLENNQLFFSMDLPADFSSTALIYKPGLDGLRALDFTVGVGMVNRLSFKGDSGEGVWEGYSANLLDMAMIDIGDEFSGEITSNTYDFRLSLAASPKRFKKASVGINLAYIA